MLYLRILSLTLLAAFMTNCASHPRTKWTDPSMRVMVDPDSLSAKDYVRIVNALQASGKWFVVDRRDGLRAIFKEQKMIYKNRPEQFADGEKYSHWGKLYGVGGVVIGNAQCVTHPGFWSQSTNCIQNLAIVSANSGQVIATAEGENGDAEMNYDGDVKIASDWTDTVDKLNNNFPKNFNPEQYSKEMLLFRQETKEQAIRMKESLGAEAAIKDSEVAIDE